MIYITKKNVIVIAQDVPKQSQKDRRQVKLQAKSVDTHTNKRARPPSVSTKTKNHITSFLSDNWVILIEINEYGVLVSGSFFGVCKQLNWVGSLKVMSVKKKNVFFNIHPTQKKKKTCSMFLCISKRNMFHVFISK